jgi:high-affinity nickel permease
VPLGIGAFCLGMPALFVFSTAPVIEWHIDNSWYRLFVPVVMTAGMFLLDMVADYVGKGAPRVAALPPAREARELVRS